jgi:hypothetical protein
VAQIFVVIRPLNKPREVVQTKPQPPHYGFVMPTHCGTSSPDAVFSPTLRQRSAIETLLTKLVTPIESFIVLASPDR